MVVFYVRILILIAWVLFSCTLWTLIALFSWRNPSLWSRTARYLSKGALKILGISVSLEGEENLRVFPAIFLINHQSALDVLLTGSICPPRAVPLGKKEIKWIPIIGWWFVGCGGMLVDRKNHKVAMKQLENIRTLLKDRKISLGIAPEGTRNRINSELLPFKKGAFHLAIESQVPLVSVVIQPYHHLTNWKNRLISRAIISIKVLPPVSTVNETSEHVDNLILKVRNQIIQTLSTFKK